MRSSTGPGDVDLDVLVVGAGLSGIGTAYRIATSCPGLRWAVVEAREAVGGTWDLFRFPGIRSDSDMFTLGFPFEPWESDLSIADGESIRTYIEQTARKHRIMERIRFGHKVVRASWDSRTARWTVECETADGPRTLTARWLHAAAGYFSYDEGYTPDYPGREEFGGAFVHPQSWPEGLDVAGRRVVVIGSGATAVTLVPALVERGAEVTMLQRSPSYVFTLGRRDPVAGALRRVLPAPTAYRLTRAKNAATAAGFYRFTRLAPKASRRLLTRHAERSVGDGAAAGDFRPRYAPWDQRVCFVPEGDFFAVLRSGRARLVTDTVERLEARGIRTGSGELLEADVVVSATGLRLRAMGGVGLVVDGEPVRLAERFLHRGVMLSGVPNASTSIGYVNATWTLRADLVAQYLTRLLTLLEESGSAAVVPRAPAGMTRHDAIGLTSGYVRRSIADFPAQGDRPPWTMPQSYLTDRRAFRRADLDDGLEWVPGGAVGGVA